MGRRMCGTYLSHQSVRFHVKNCVIGEGETKLGILNYGIPYSSYYVPQALECLKKMGILLGQSV